MCEWKPTKLLFSLEKKNTPQQVEKNIFLKYELLVLKSAALL